ncbi:VOC family protein [Haloarcula nitratireducens]|uniref:VOC family protein n=1 Tax=Haloarcula nitratireducens TaxID=2487749 RepID=A0AAW4P6T5_9EURY|nr:VOC family protein [Halomicroarcula nitratireducens]MBX0293330.1 VOC family protein [Halomicroarcula nitratireducens]
MPQPRPMAHVGVTVPDIDAALEWYEDVLDFRRLLGPMEVDGDDDSQMARLCRDVLGEFETVRIAHTTSGNGTGVEFFEFDDVTPSDPDPHDAGFFHICVVDPDIEELAADIEAAGGSHHTDVWRLFPDQEYRMTYCKDPWDNIVEIYTHDYQQTYSNQE